MKPKSEVMAVLLAAALALAASFEKSAMAVEQQPAPEACAAALAPSPLQKLEQWARSNWQAPAMDAFQAYQGLLSGPTAEDVRRTLRPEAVYEVLANEEQAYYSENLKAVLERAGQNATAAQLDDAMRAVLVDKVPAASIESRVAAVRDGSAQSLRRALGDLELNELQQLVHGGDPLHPTPDSLLGRYIAETGAATVVRGFNQGAEYGGGNGPERLVVALSQQTWDAYLRYFGRMEFLFHIHTPQQGTLQIGFNRMVGNWRSFGAELRLPSPGTMMPQILLKTTEAQRMTRIMALGHQSYSFLTEPWSAYPGYCATGGYNSCTHWFGNLPLGDRLVEEYAFPGAVDQYAGSHLPGVAPNSPEDKAPRRQRLQPYQSDNALAKSVWKVPGHEQLADILGLGEHNLRGEFANPGWVAVMLTGWAGVDRVPFVFYVVQDHRAPIPANFDPMIHAY